MANNTGLPFNPNATLGNWDWSQNTSVPNVVDDYLKPQVSPINIQWKPEQLQKVRNLISSSPENYDYMLPIREWEGGIAGLSEDRRKAWEEENAGRFFGKDEAWADRLWRNQQYANTFGLQDFYDHPNKDERDARYRDYIINRAVEHKFGNNDNINQILGLTSDGKLELLNSDYKSDWQMKNEDKESESNSWWDYSLGDRWNAITSKAVSRGTTGMGIGSVAGGVVGGGIGTIAGIGIGGAVGMLSGILEGIAHPEDAEGLNQMKRKAENEDILNKVTIADNERMKEASRDEIDGLWFNYIKAYRNGQLSEGEINSQFDKLALNGQRTTTDELGNTEQYDYTGSNYYTMFKDSDEFEHFGPVDKLKYLAQSQILARKHGQGAALRALEQDMQNHVSENQSGWTWAGNSLKNVWVGGVANLANNVTALGSLAAYNYYGTLGRLNGEDYNEAGGRALAEYLKGKDASGNGENNWFNPMYWNKVDQYNTFDKDAIAKAEANGGVSEYDNVYAPGTENSFWSWQTLNEAVRMNKFAWSDLVKNIALGKLVRGATRLTGGIEIAPGVLATESTGLSQAVNKIGALGVMNASSLGIDAAYGMQTYEEVLRQNNEKLDKVINADVEAEVQKRIQTPQAQKELRDFIDAENARRRERAEQTEGATWFPVDEKQAFLDYVEHLKKQVRQEQEALHTEDRQQAESDAANAYAIDASIEHLRMATTNGVFKSYLFDKGTLNALKANNPYVATTTKNGVYALAKHATRNKALQTLGMNIWGGFHSNYFDDVTVGFAEGFGIQDYNNYLLQKYNPAAYGSILDDYVNPYIAAIAGIEESMGNKRSFLDGGIGALGSVFTVSPNVLGWVSHRQRMKEAAKKQGKEKDVLSWQERMSDFVNNPVLQAVADAKASTRMTEAEIKRVNDIIKENGYSLDNIVETATALNQKAITREGTSLLEAEDAKDREAFALATSLLSLKNSGVVQNAQAEPNRAKWSIKKKAAHTIGRGLNALMGVQLFDEAESSYTKAIRSLQDAATIGESDDAATQERQKELLNTFLGLDQNKNILSTMSEEEKVSFAQERLKKNATNLLDMMERTEQLQKKFENSVQAQLNPDLKQQLMYQYALDSRWKSRLSDLEQQITGEEASEEKTFRPAESVIAKYGSMKGYEKAKKAQEKRVEEAQKAYESAEMETKKSDDSTKSIVENARQKAVRMWKKKSAAINLKKEKAALERVNNEEAELKSVLESGSPVVKAEDILKLNSNDRLRILDDFYRSDYSQAQQAEIDKAKNILIADGTPINEAMERVKDAAILSNRIEDNMEVAKRIMQNPVEANQMQQALAENRRKAVINYFNDKIVAEAFMDFQREPESTLSAEKVVDKAKGYSTAVLNGMLKEIERQIPKTRGEEEMDDKTLSNLEDGIKTVLDERDAKLKETAALDSFIRKTRKVNHTETQPVMIQLNDEQTVPSNMTEQITTERELSENDKRLLDTALDYAAERGISIDNLENEVITEGFNNYLQERNHAYDLALNPFTGETYETNVGTVDNRTNPVSPEYMTGLLKDVMEAYKANKEAVQAAKADKPTASKAESVATAPVETKGTKPKEEGAAIVETREEVDKPDGINPNDPFGVRGKKSGESATTQSETTVDNKEKGENNNSENTPQRTGRNGEILDNAATLNSSLLEDVDVLLDEVDKMNMPEQTREKIKDLIDSHLGSKPFRSIQELQNQVFEDAMITNDAEAPLIASKATALAGLNINSIKAKRTSTSVNKASNTTEDGRDNTNNESTKYPNPFPPTPLILETRDLDILMNYPIWKDYIQQHGVVEFLQKLSDAWNKEAEAWRQSKKQGLLHQSQVVFIYDPALARDVESSFEGRTYNPEIDAPIIMALEITDKNKHLVDDEAQLITIKDKADGKTKQYQMIGAMPSSEVKATESDTMRATAMRMSSLRGRINYNDSDTHVLRYAPDKDNGKYNGSVIRTDIEKVTSHTENDRFPHSTETTPKKGTQQLMNENLNSATESFVKATEEERQAYEEAKSKGLSGIRNNKLAKDLYERMKNAFIDRLFKRERKSQDPDDPKAKEMNFRIQKGTSNTYPKIVLTKPVGQTLDRNTGRLIVDLLREVDGSEQNAKEVINSNSRFERLSYALSKLQLSKGLFNAEGVIVNKTAYDKAIAEFEGAIKNAISNNLEVGRDSLRVRVDLTEGRPEEKTINISLYAGDINNNDNLLTTVTTKYTGQISQAEVASLLKDLILDKEGKVRINPKDSRFELVKWQVNYEDANTANDKSLPKKVRDAARDNLGKLYDDGIFEMQVTKLVYPSRSVVVRINGPMRSKLYAVSDAAPATPAANATGTVANFEAEGVGGKIDGDTGMMTETPTKESITRGIPRKILDTVRKMIADSNERNLTGDGRHYSIAGQLYSRVTSIKYALDKMGRRFDPNSPYAIPSSLLGNSVDEFGRDVLNGVFDNMSDAERAAAFEGYDNSTAKNYAEVFQSFKAFEARLAGMGQVVIATGNKENPGHITAKGMLDVTVRKDGKIENKKVRVAGTLDVLAIDKDGNLHIYDFKTKHNAMLTKEQAIDESKGYDRQLSMYAKFLEEEYGLKVKSINIIPIKVEYPSPRTQADYKESRPGSNQLMKRNAKGEYEEFNAANYEVGKEFNLTRLNDAELVASFDKMTDAEKEALVEAIQDQAETPAAEVETKAEQIVDAKPEVTVEEEEEEEGGFSKKGRLGRRNRATKEQSSEETAQAINPSDNNGLLNRLKELENACRNQK